MGKLILEEEDEFYDVVEIEIEVWEDRVDLDERRLDLFEEDEDEEGMKEVEGMKGVEIAIEVVVVVGVGKPDDEDVNKDKDTLVDQSIHCSVIQIFLLLLLQSIYPHLHLTSNY